MNYNNLELSNITEAGLYNIDTGVKLFDLTPVDFTMKSNTPTPKEVFQFGKYATLEFEDTRINKEVMDMLIGKDTPTKGFTIEYDTVLYQKQNRVHKINRINKKWAKRYGYRDVIATYSADLDYKEAFKTDSQDFNCTFNNIKLIKIDGKEVKNK